MQAFQTGAVLGLTLAILIGPVFFALLQTSINRGFQAGLFLALGIVLSDSMYIAFTNLFIAYIPSGFRLEFWLALFGGIVLILIGIRTLMKKPQLRPKDQLDKKTHDILDEELAIPRGRKPKFKEALSVKAGIRLATKGFLLNVAHPGVLLFWISVIGLISVNFEHTGNEKLVLYGTTISVVFLTDVWKAFLASRIRGLLTYNVMLWINRVMGVVLIGFGVQLLARVVTALVTQQHL